MPIRNRFAARLPDHAAWRRDFHAHPELGFDCHRTAAVVAEKLRAFGCDAVEEGIGVTGVVGLIHGRHGPGRCIGLRADMDALPMNEATGLPYASTVPGRMHGCGHDGHMVMLLAAAEYRCERAPLTQRSRVMLRTRRGSAASAKVSATRADEVCDYQEV